MMTIRELRAYFDKKADLRQINLTLDGLREYRKSGQDSPEVNAGIITLENESLIKAAELEAKADAVRSTLDSVEDAFCRTLAKLHYCDGLSWDEVGAMCGLSMYGAKQKAYRAMRKARLR